VGNQTTESIERRSRAFAVVKEIRKDLTKHLTGADERERVGRDYQKWRFDITKAIDLLRKEKVFSFVGSRSHPGFEKYDMKYLYIDNIAQYKKKLHEQFKLFDTARHFWDNFD
jgi:hypothetical protein